MKAFIEKPYDAKRGSYREAYPVIRYDCGFLSEGLPIT